MDDSEAEAPQRLALPLLHGAITLSRALEEEENMLIRLKYPEQRLQFFTWVHQHRAELQTAVSHHLGLLAGEICRLGEVREWLYGSFNVCIPVYTENWKRHPGRRVMLRLPLPYKIGESSFPGNAEEKIRTEAASSIWLQQHCPDVPIPLFWGFGLPNRRRFIRVEMAPFLSKLRWHLRNFVAHLLHQAPPHPYVTTRQLNDLEHGYMISDFIEEADGEMLGLSWNERRGDDRLRANLFQSLARIVLSLSKVPQARIGAWTIDDQGGLSLSNRPLLLHIHALENGGIETGIPRTHTYANTEEFYSDLLNLHDSRIRSQPNSLFSEADGTCQMANLFVMRGLIPQFTPRDRRHGPFVLTLTDLHGPNIFVDSDWNIKAIVDLEWTASLPIEMSAPPYWLTNRGIDELTGEHLTDFERVLEEFLMVFESEERSYRPLYGSPTYRSDIVRQAWTNGTTFFLWALCSLKGCYNIFKSNIQPKYVPEVNRGSFADTVFPYWDSDARNVLESKLEDKASYAKQLRQLYADDRLPPAPPEPEGHTTADVEVHPADKCDG